MTLPRLIRLRPPAVDTARRTILRLIPAVTALAVAATARCGEPGSPSALPDAPTVADYVRVGLLNNPALTAALESHRAALARIPQARSLPDPRVSVTAFVDPVVTRNGPQDRVLTLSQTIPWIGKLDALEHAASAEAEAARSAYETTRLELVRTIGVAAFEYAYLARDSEVIEETLDLLRRLDPIVREKVRGGGGLDAALRLEVELGVTEDRLAGLRRERLRQSASLRGLLLLDPGSSEPLPWPHLPESLPTAPDSPAALAPQLADHHPALAELRARIDAATARERHARLAPLPDPTIGATFSDIRHGEDAWGVTIGFSIPLWFERYRSARREAEAASSAARSHLASREATLTAELAAAVESLRDARERAERFRSKLIPAATQALEIAETSYRSGDSTVVDLFDVERSLLDLRQRYWRAVSRAHASALVIETLLGKETTP